MVFVLLVSVLFREPLTFLILSVGREENHRVQLEPMIKAHSSGRMVCSGISDVVITSEYSEKTRLKKLMIITNKLQETTVFSDRQKLTSTMKQKSG